MFGDTITICVAIAVSTILVLNAVIINFIKIQSLYHHM